MTSLPTLTSTKNPLVQRAIKLHHASGRKKEAAFLLEGHNAIEQALKHPTQWQLTHIFIPEHKTPPTTDAMIQPVNDSVLKAIGTTSSAPPIAAIAVRPSDFTPWHWTHLTTTTPRFFILDNLQDPGNVGTLIRSANAFGLDAILLTGNSADPFSPKTIRSSAGHSLSTPLYHTQNSLIDTLTELAKQLPHQPSLNLWGTCGERTPENEPARLLSPDLFPSHQGHAILLGNEGQGLPIKALSKSALPIQWLTIPTQNVESLNVAISGSIIGYVLASNPPS